MILTTKGRYAVSAMLELAQSESTYATCVAHIAEKQKIPQNYLEQIFVMLRHHGIIRSVRGPGGGYKLCMAPNLLSIYEIICAVEEEISITKCGNNKEKSCIAPSVQCSAHHVWAGLENKIITYLSNLSLSDVLNGNIKISAHSTQLDKDRTYLDYNATTPLDPQVKDFMNSIPSIPLNPSSLHWYGRTAEAIIENARTSIAKALNLSLGVGGYQITFTSSGTEANNLILHNFANKHIVISSVEHLSIINTLKHDNKVQSVPVDQNGQINIEALSSILHDTPEGSLLSIISANNETGVIQNDMQKIVDLAHKYKIFVHSDCVQTFGKIAYDYSVFDFITISSHKIGGPIGAAALVHRTNIAVLPQILGGGQERGLRSGTENVSSIAGFGKAAELMHYNLSKYMKIAILRDKMEQMIQEICPNIIIFGKNTLRLPNTSVLMMPNIDAQKQLIMFDLENIAVSAGSACSSGKMKTSHVLLALGANEQQARCAIRISLGPDTTIDHIQKFVATWKKIFNKEIK